MARLILVLGVLGFLAPLSGCALRDLGKDIAAFERLGAISGETLSLDGPGSPTLVVLFDLGRLEPVMVSYRVQLQPGSFTFLQPPGRYLIVAFEDLDRDFVYQAGEPLGHAGRDNPIELESSGAVGDLTVAMSRGARPPGGVTLDLSHRHWDGHLAAMRRNVGMVASLDDARFSAASGRAASNRPLEALRSGGVGVFFLEAYDPKRIPVLFVHGMNGSPQDMRPLIESLDRERFQAWFVAYPSTLRLEALASFFHEAILDLGVTYDLRRLYVVAHSMGGLVGRGFINKNVAEEKRELIQLFVTFSTPFGGHKAAAVIDSVPGALKPTWISGVSWVDLVPNSKFIQDLYRAPLGSYVDHHLFFAYVPGQHGDGVIELESQLDPRAEASARAIHAEPATHTGILESARVHARIRTILADAWERDASALRPDRYVERTTVALSTQSNFRFDSEGRDASARMEDFGAAIRARAGSLDALFRSPAVRNAVARANSDPAAADPRVLRERDQRWASGEAAAVIAEATDPACNEALAEHAAAEPAVAEIIVTGRGGGNVCQSRISSDYYQADEAWWTRTVQEGRVWYGQLAYDESADAFGVSVYVPLSGDGDGPAGVAKVVVREP